MRLPCLHSALFCPGRRLVANALGVLALVSLLAAGATAASAAWISTGGSDGERVAVRLLDSSEDRVLIEFTIPGFDAEPVTIDGRTYYRLQLPGESNLLETGMPELPHVARSVIIPDAAGMRARVVESDPVEFSGMPVVPSKGNLLRTVDPATVPYTFSAQYGSVDAWPEAPVRLGEPYILRDYRGIVVDAMPFLAEGDGTLRVARRMVVEVTAEGVDLRNAIDRAAPPAKVVHDFVQIYSEQFLNFGQGRYTPVGEVGTMLIITHDAFRPNLDPLVQWKLQAGIPVTVVDVSTIGNNSTAIKNYIAAQYTPDGLAYVLLVGDAAQVATPSAAGGSSDPTYACIAGGDRYPELFIGRFSAENPAHVDTQVQRTVEYEKNPMAGAEWYRKGTGIASNQGPGDDGEYDNQHQDVIRGKLLNYGYSLVDQIYDPTGTASMVATALNNGRSIVNYTGHGSTTSWSSTGFSNTHVAALQNDWMLPFITSVACVNGQFSGYTCFAEAWLRSIRAGTGAPIGAVGTYMSSINQSWNPPMCGQDEIIDLLVGSEMFTYGGLCYNGSCQMMDEYGATDGGDMFLTWHIFGDPSLLVRSKIPAAVTAQHDGTLLIGQMDYAVTVPGRTGARCALYGGGVLYGVGYTDHAGAATIALNPQPAEPMTLTLTVTAPNIIPVITPVEVVAPTGPFLVHQANLVEDPEGDGDGQCDAGETVNLWITLRNVGVDQASGVTAVIAEDDEFVECVVTSANYGDIPAGGSVQSLTAYQLSFASNTPDNHACTVQLTVTAAEGSWARTFPMTIGAPILEYASHVVDDDPPAGNGTGWLEPGETFELVLTMANTGHANANQTTVTVKGAEGLLEILEGTATCENIPAGGQGSFTPLMLRVVPGCPVPSVITVTTMFGSDHGYADAFAFQVPVGGFADDCEMNRGWTLGAPDDNATSGQWILADPVGTVYNGSQAQPEDDHTPIPGVMCFVTGNGSPGGAAGDADVDGGKTTLLSPIFDLSRVESAIVNYWFWYTNDLGNNPAQDTWKVEVTANGTTWVPLESSMASPNAWTERTFELEDFITLSEQVRFRFVAEDLSPGSLIEAAVDDFQLIVGQPSAGVEEQAAVTRFALSRPTPNPFSRAAELRFAVPQASPVSVEVFDVSGRLVRTLVSGALPAGEHAVRWDGANGAGHRVGAGVYFVRMSAPGFTQVRTVTLVQ